MCQMRGFRFSINCQPFNLQALFEHLSRTAGVSKSGGLVKGVGGGVVGMFSTQYSAFEGPSWIFGYGALEVTNKLRSRRERKWNVCASVAEIGSAVLVSEWVKWVVLWRRWVKLPLFGDSYPRQLSSPHPPFHTTGNWHFPAFVHFHVACQAMRILIKI